MTTHFSPHISLANFRVSQNIPDKSYMTLSSITQTIIPLTGNQAEERKLHVYWRTEQKQFVSWKNIDCRWDVNRIFSGRKPAGLYVNHTRKTNLYCYDMREKKMKFNQTLILYDKWDELRRWKFHTLVYSNRTTNHVTIKVKLFD